MKIYDKTGNILLDVEVDDTSVRYKAIKGENSLTLKYSLAEHIEIPLGSYCIFKNERYYLMLPENFTMKHRRNFEYNLLMYSEDARSKRYKFINPVDGRLKFSLTAKPVEHLQMFVDNMNMRDGNGHWSVGQCPDHVEIVLSYNHTFCYDALVQLANELELDYWFNGNVVNLGKLELNKDNPLPLSYGGDGEGLKQDIKRTNYSDSLPLDILFVQGSDRNIDASKYGSSELHMPKGQVISFDGTHFDNEDGFDVSRSRSYVVDSNGYSIKRLDKDIENNSEDSIDCTEIYPTKEETVVSVIEVNKDKHFYDILFESTVDYGKYTINGEKATIIFQSGMLAGKEFDLATDNKGNLICKRENGHWRMEIVPQEIDGIIMPDPDSGYIPNAGNGKDAFKVFNIQLPDEYISNNATKSGAEWDMLRYAVKHMYSNEDVQYTITGTLDEIYAKRNWENIEGRLQLGNYISFSDKSFQAEPLLIRITGIKEYVNKPHSPELEISNAAIGGTLIGALNRIENEEAHTDELVRQSRNFTKRRFRSAQETLEMLQAAFANFSEGISPVTVRTMAMLVGDESLQFKFTASRSSLTDIPCPLTYNESTKQLSSVPASLVHMTLGIDEITAPGASSASDYKGWDIPSFDSAILDDSEKSYYVYIKASSTNTYGEVLLSDKTISMEEISGYYHFLVGILNSEYNGSRDFVTLYGFTEVLPGQITTDVIRSADGQTYFDLSKGEIGGLIKFKSNRGVEKSVADLEDEQNNAIAGVQDQIDGVVENWNGEGTPTTTNAPVSNWRTDAEKIAHINDTYINIEEYVDDETTPTAGHAWRWCKCDDATIEDKVTVTDKDGNRFNLHWHPIADSDAVRALKEASEAKSLAESNIQRLNALYDDGLITQAEKFEFFQEEAFVHTDKAEIDNQVQKYGLTENKMYISYLSAYNNYEAAIVAINTATDDQFPLSVAELWLVWKTNAYYGTRNNVLQEIANAVKNAIDAAQSSANKAISDTEHLVNAFAKGETNISGGVVMTQMVAVGDGGENIDAFLNGSDFAEDDTHGKLLLAAGVPEGTTDLEERAKESATRIYEDGHIETNDIKATGGKFTGNLSAQKGNIGPLYLGDFSVLTKYVELDGYTTNCAIDEIKGMGVVAKSADGNTEVNLSLGNGSSTMASGAYDIDGNYYQVYVQYEEGAYFSVRKKNTSYACALKLNAENTSNTADALYIQKGNITNYGGIFKGLRPNVASPTSNYYAGELDHTIFVEKSGITIYLPKSPKTGQRYEIFKPYSNSVNIDSQGVQVYSSGSYNGNNGKGTNVTQIGNSAFVRAVYIYTGTYWFRTVESYD